MNFSAFVARRYLFSKKSHNVINIISSISLIGVATGTMALVIVLSVLNGFDDLLKSVFSSFDPDLKITTNLGKVFDPNTAAFDSVKNLSFIEVECGTLEENVLLEYDKRTYPAVIKGVPDSFKDLSGVDTMIRDGEYLLKSGDMSYAIMGSAIAYYLSVGLNFLDPIFIYVPKRTGRISMNPARAFNKKHIFPKGVFAIQQNIDTKYILVPIDFARDLLSYPLEVTQLELKLKADTDPGDAKEIIQAIIGNGFTIKDRYEQHEVLYRVMKSEKFATYMILTFILLVASFNIIGSLSMLIIDKKNDITTLRSLGLDKDGLRKIFMIEGWLISIGGAIIGLVVGGIICYVQQEFGLLKLNNFGDFLVDAYPVQIRGFDFLVVFITVVTIGLIASWYPVKYFTKRYLNE
ncbi:MAG: ABC transporter permease [Salinivirgaceae bacterium]|nr:ABC transporter permease [Salinivirgaceae bacterium]